MDTKQELRLIGIIMLLLSGVIIAFTLKTTLGIAGAAVMYYVAGYVISSDWFLKKVQSMRKRNEGKLPENVQ